MTRYKIAELSIEMKYASQTLLKQAESYRKDGNDPVDMTIQIAEQRLKRVKEAHTHLSLNDCEYILTGFDFYRLLLDFNGFGLHSSAVALNNKAVLFSAPCGTGKSTHARLWQQQFGTDKALILNDDKPALRLIENTFYVYGTPWSGKSDLNLNQKVPLQAIVFLEQAKENHIRQLNSKEALKLLIYQSLRTDSDPDKMIKLLTLHDHLLNKIPIYQMGCTVSTDAVMLVYHTVNK
ncbi:hypothetical protein [Desulfosporosinus sp. FKA]|uniref:hypothetical protein n=1 Tax=Desulfosporosinus sp. FKA TaxID=1969834 RepID=UPI000B4A0BAB|nr:hypothetical protein [Desulfosporosinus sp. FKA]